MERTSKQCDRCVNCFPHHRANCLFDGFFIPKSIANVLREFLVIKNILKFINITLQNE